MQLLNGEVLQLLTPFRFVQMQFHKGFDSIRLQTEIRYIMVDGLVTNYTILFCTLGSSCGSRPLIFCGLATERKWKCYPIRSICHQCTPWVEIVLEYLQIWNFLKVRVFLLFDEYSIIKMIYSYKFSDQSNFWCEFTAK